MVENGQLHFKKPFWVIMNLLFDIHLFLSFHFKIYKKLDCYLQSSPWQWILFHYIFDMCFLTGVRKIAPRKVAPRSESGFDLGLALELGLGGNFPRTFLTIVSITVNESIFSDGFLLIF